MANKTLYVLDAVWRGGQAVKKASDEFDKLNKEAGDGFTDAAKKFGKGALAVGGALVGIGFAANAAWDALGEGAQIVKLQGEFDNLAGSIDITSESLMTSLKAATDGMVSDAQLIAGASEMISMGLADTEDTAVRLVSATSQLGTDIQQLTMTMLNDSELRLDQLGLSATRVKEISDELKQSGFVGDAFDEAVIIALEERVELLGDASDTTAGQIKMIEAAIANVKDAGLIALTEGAADGLGNVAESAEDAEVAIVNFATASGTLLGGLVGAVADVGNAFGGLAGMINELNIATYGSLAELQDFFGMDSSSTRAFVASEQGIRRNWLGLVGQFDYNPFTTATSGYAGGVTTATSDMSDYGRTVSDIGEKQRMAASHTATLSEEITRGTSSFGSYRSEADMLAEELFSLAKATGDYYDQAQKAGEVDPLQAIRDGITAGGGTAWDKYIFDITSGLVDAEQAQQDLNEAFTLMRGEELGRMVAAGEITPEQAIAMMNDANVTAQEFFETIDTEADKQREIMIDANADPAYATTYSWLAWADSLVAHPRIEPVWGDPSGGGSSSDDDDSPDPPKSFSRNNITIVTTGRTATNSALAWAANVTRVNQVAGSRRR